MKSDADKLDLVIKEYCGSLGIKIDDMNSKDASEIMFPENINALNAIRDIFDANEAIVIALIDQHKCSIAAYAKEGLIKQSTSKRAIEKIKKASCRYTNLEI